MVPVARHRTHVVFEGDILTGRAPTRPETTSTADIQSQSINRSNVWTSGIEWMMLFRKSALLAVDGFDEPSRRRGYAVASLRSPGHHFAGAGLRPAVHVRSLILRSSQGIDISTQSKGRAYGRGLGYVLRIHKIRQIR